MTSHTVDDPSANPSVPLAPEIRSAYQDLYNKIQAGIDGTMDLAALQALNRWSSEVDQVLTKDDECKLAADTTAFIALRSQINSTNKGLKDLRDEIASIESHFAMARDIIGAIENVISLVPGV